MWNRIGPLGVMCVARASIGGRSLAVPSKDYLIRQVATLLKFARLTSNPSVAAVLLDKAADLNEKVDELPSLQTDMSPSPPDVVQ